MNNQVIAMNGGGGGGLSEGAEGNDAPTITPAPEQTITLPHAATIAALVTDDGLPKPRPPRAGTPARGPLLRVQWLQFRGPAGGRVVLQPETSPVTDGKASTTATFTAPGRYVIQGIAVDGAASRSAGVTVMVNPSSGSPPAR